MIAALPYLNIYGTGGFARQVIPSVLSLQQKLKSARQPDFGNIVFVDDSSVADTMLGLQIRSSDQMNNGELFIVAVADGRTRKRLVDQCENAGLIAYSMISPDSRVAVDSRIGIGCVMCDYTIIEPYAKIGVQFQCNIYSYVAHDCLIGDYVTFAPRVSCNGNVHIGDYAYIGTGAVIKQGTSQKPLVIGEGAIVGMGAVVTKDVPAGATVVGNPARIRE